MADDDLIVTWKDFDPFVKRFNDMEEKIKIIEKAPTQTPSSGIISSEHTPYIVQHYYLPHSHQASQEFPPRSPSETGSSNKLPTNIDKPEPARTIVKGGALQKPDDTSQPHPVTAPEQQHASRPRMLATIHRGLRPVRVPGSLTDLPTGSPMLLIPDGLPKAFRGKFNIGYEGPAKGVPGHWEYFSEGPPGDTSTGSSEEMAHTNLGGQGHWTPDIVRPSADQVEELRKRLRAAKSEDVTRGIDLSRLPDDNPPKEERDKLLKNSLSAHENKKQKDGGTGTNSSTLSELKNTAKSLIDSVEGSDRPNDAADDRTGKPKPGFTLIEPTPKNKITMGVDIDPVENKAAIIEQRTRFGGSRSGSTAQAPSTAPSQKPNRHASVPTMQTDPVMVSELKKNSGSKKGTARKEKTALTSRNDTDARIENTNGTTKSEHDRSAEAQRLLPSSQKDDEIDSELSDFNEDILEAGDPERSTRQEPSRKKRRASEADPDIGTEPRRPQKSLKTISKRAASEQRRPFTPMTNEKAGVEIRARMDGARDLQDGRDLAEEFEEDEDVQDKVTEKVDSSAEEEGGKKSEDKRKGKGKSEAKD